MTDSSSATPPHWHHLPHNPQAFFELEEGYDRKDLKRKYNTLLRQYKPEKFPEEFQKLRSAFEALDNQLRYGQRMVLPQFDKNWGADESDSHTPESTASRTSPVYEEQRQSKPPKTLADRLETEPPDAILKELLNKTDKSPYDYYAIAILADTHPDRKSSTLLRWVLSGLKAHPRDMALFNLLYQIVRHDYPAKGIPKLLTSIASVIRDDRYYFLTEPLWDKLIRTVDFRSFKKLLNQCESELRDHRIDSRMTFYAHLLRSAMWKADESWIAEKFGFIEENYQELPPSLEIDIEILSSLREYLRTRNSFLNGGVVKHAIDACIRDYCMLEDHDAEHSYLNLQVQLASGDLDALNAFDKSDSLESPWFSMWSWMDMDYSNRLGVEDPDEYSDGKAKRRRSIATLVETMQAQTNNSSTGQLWNCSVFIYSVCNILLFCVAAILLMLLVIIVKVYFSDIGMVLSIVIIIASFTFGLGQFVVNRTTLPLFQKSYWALARRCYNKFWQSELLAYIRRSHLPLRRVLRLIHHSADEDDNFNNTVITYAVEDIGLTLHSMSVKYLA